MNGKITMKGLAYIDYTVPVPSNTPYNIAELSCRRNRLISSFMIFHLVHLVID